MEGKWMWLSGFFVIMAAGAVYWSYSNQPAKPIADSNLNLAVPQEQSPNANGPANEAPPIVDTPVPHTPEADLRRLPPLNPSNPPPSNNPIYPQPFEGNPGMGQMDPNPQMDPNMDPMMPPTNPPFFDDEYHPPDEYAGPPMQEGMQQGIPPQPNPFGADEYDE